MTVKTAAQLRTDITDQFRTYSHTHSLSLDARLNAFLNDVVDSYQGTDADLTLWAAITPGTGVGTALAVNVGSAGAIVTNGGALGTPSSGTLTNATGLPISTGVSGLGAGVADFLGTPSSANLAAAVTGETGSGALVFGTAPTLSTLTVSAGGAAITGDSSVVGTIDVSGVATIGPSNNVTVGLGGFTASANSQIYGSATAGCVLGGEGSSDDFTLINKNGSTVATVPTGTNDIVFSDRVTAVSFYSGANKVLGAQGAAIADATDAASAITQLNLLLAAARTHGFIAT